MHLSPQEFRDLAAQLEAATTDPERVSLLTSIVTSLIEDLYPPD